MNFRSTQFVISIVIPLAFSLSYFWLIQQARLGVTHDGVGLIQLANAFQSGNFTSDVSQNVSPLFPFILALVSMLTNFDILTNAALLQAVILFFTLFLSIELLKTFHIHPLFQVFFFIFLLASKPLGIFSYLLGDGLFLCISLWVYLQFRRWLITQKKLDFWLFCGLMGILVLSRYAGIGFALGSGFFLLFLQNKKWKLRLIESIALIGTTLCALILWLTFTHFTGMNWTSRGFSFHPIDSLHGIQFLSTLKDWFFSNPFYTIPAWLIISLILGSILISLLLLRKSTAIKQLPSKLKKEIPQFQLISSLLVGYLFFLAFSISFIDAHTPLDNRILAPIFPFLLFAFVLLFSLVQSEKKMRLFSFVLCLLFTLKVSFNFYSFWKNQYEFGSGFTAKTWRKSETLRYLKENSRTSYATNGLELIEFQLPENKKSVALPTVFSVNTNQSNASFKHELKLLQTALQKGNIEIIYFDEINWKKYGMTRNQVLKIDTSAEIRYFQDGFLIRKHQSK